jgi:DNA-binding PadR family transcriptional regulator
MTNRLILLGILLEGKMHGYQLNEYVKHVMSLYADLKRSTTYFTLGQLEKEGYVSYETERKGKRPERRVYSITEKGKKYFYELLRVSISNYVPVYSSDNITVTFMDKLETQEVRQLLEAKKKKIQSELKKFNETPDHQGSLKYAVDHSIAYLETDLRWVEGMLKDISAEQEN